MTTAKSNAGTPGTTRGRGLDALFEGATAPSSARSSIDADLAALLDDEVSAAETGRSTVAPATAERAVADSVPSQPPNSIPTTPSLQPESVRSDSIDVPPSAGGGSDPVFHTERVVSCFHDYVFCAGFGNGTCVVSSLLPPNGWWSVARSAVCVAANTARCVYSFAPCWDPR